MIGKYDDTLVEGTLAIGNSLKRLVDLRVLNLSKNRIGLHDYKCTKGTEGIGYSLEYMQFLIWIIIFLYNIL